MRLAGIIFLSLLYIFSYTELHELFTLPSLLDHYREHRQYNASTGFGAFLLSHYGGAKHEADHEHGDLPFSNDRCVHSIMSCPLSMPDVFVTDFELPEMTASTDALYYRDMITSPPPFSFWQPPRLKA